MPLYNSYEWVWVLLHIFLVMSYQHMTGLIMCVVNHENCKQIHLLLINVRVNYLNFSTYVFFKS